ncbi:MAG: IS21 family transposase [Deltaproteobacteria bacterium]|nr:IS21 family transposase [Deltaproteobacteria bacterium]
MLDQAIVSSIEGLRRGGHGVKRIALLLGVSKNTVRRYLRHPKQGQQLRPRGRKLTAAQQAHAIELWRTSADGNAVVVQDLLAEEGVSASLRTVQRIVAAERRAVAVREATTVRFETPAGQQMQVDFGERRVLIGGVEQTVYFFVATLGYSRRTFVRAGLSQRQDEWKLGLEGALVHFSGRPEQVVVDNAKALILRHTPEDVKVHPAFEAYCRDRHIAVFACKPYRARTKGKVESGVKYVKRNAIARRAFADFASLEKHLVAWMAKADERIHGTTHERPIDRFNAAERAALQPLHNPDMQVTTQRLRRTVANDCYVDVDTVRYSVPHRLARTTVDVQVSGSEVVIWSNGQEVARHARSQQRHERVTSPGHFAGLVRGQTTSETGALASYGRSLADYATAIGGVT